MCHDEVIFRDNGPIPRVDRRYHIKDALCPLHIVFRRARTMLINYLRMPVIQCVKKLALGLGYGLAVTTEIGIGAMATLAVLSHLSPTVGKHRAFRIVARVKC